MRMELRADTPQILRFPRIEELIAQDELVSAFQPIVAIDAPAPRIFGFESLARFRSSSPFLNPEVLFDYAERTKQLFDLDLALLERSFAAAAALPPSSKIFLNVHPHVLSNPDRIVPNLILRADRSGIPLERIVVEITEQAAFSDERGAIESVEELRAAGIALALDDVGIAYSHLSLIDRIRPSYLKISGDFGTGFEADPMKRRIVRNIFSLGCDFGLDVIIEGVETESTAGAARDLGIPLAQGFYFARPAAAESFRSAA
jgi:EAL domain-containing protein (putative c-di-GMP-specific phosphodiesterase class I)